MSSYHLFPSSGQEISNPYSTIRRNLKLLFIEYCDRMSSKEQSNLQFLIEEFSEERSPFREKFVARVV